MSLKKIIVNGLAVVGAVVVADKIVNAVCNKSTKAISEELLKKFSHDDNNKDAEHNEDAECDEDLCEDEEKEDVAESEDSSFPDIEKYDDPSEDDDDKEKTYEFTVKAENITSDPKEV